MVKKLCMTAVSLLVSIMALAQLDKDSTVMIIDGMKVPLVEKKYVAPTHFVDNWYIGLAGGTYGNYGSNDSHSGFFQLFGPAASFTVGKEITPVSGFRLQIFAGRNTGVKGVDKSFEGYDGGLDNYHNRYNWTSYGLSIQYLPNFTNMIMGFREKRIFALKGIIGIGGSVSQNYNTEKRGFEVLDKGDKGGNGDTYANKRRSLVQLTAGLQANFILSPKWDINVEALANFLDNSYDSNTRTKNTWDGHFDLLVGATYHFKNKGGVTPGFFYPRHDMDIYKKRLDAIDDLRDKARQRRKEVEEEIPDTIDVDAHVMYTLIAFDEGSTTVDRLQQTNIFTTASAWVKAPKSIIYITNSTAVDDKLFRARAEAITNILLERYEIPASRIKIEADEQKVKPSASYIVFIIND